MVRRCKTPARLVLLATILLAVVACGGDTGSSGAVGVYRSAQSHWKPPELNDPIRVGVDNDHASLKLDPARDYVVEMPSEPLTRPRGLAIVGGHDVVLIGGEIRIDWQGRSPDHNDRRGLLLKDQTGTVHIEGLKIGGKDLGEGIDLDQRQGATVQLVNLQIGEVQARDSRNFSDTHPDLVQAWAGPRRLRIDGLSGRTGYQGLFLLPRQFDGTLDIKEISIRNVAITGTRTSRYLLWTNGGPKPRLSNVWIRGARGRSSQYLYWPHARRWRGARLARFPDRHLPRRATAGISYTPGASDRP